ncbi:MAG: type 1 glutamine amidotransferase [Phycisphaerae bacterium]|jgi:protease I|nr:type 1 glutamine amidotransferase [Phycisphaerae bacterium]
MKALILTADGFEDMELFYPLYRMKEENIDVDIAGSIKGEVFGKHGYRVEANLTFAQVNPDQYDLLILPGGKGPEKVRLDTDALKITKTMMESCKVIAAICHASQILISAGLVKDKQMTCWQGVRDDLKAAGAHYLDREVVIDGNLITSRMPDDLPAFCRTIFSVLKIGVEG